MGFLSDAIDEYASDNEVGVVEEIDIDKLVPFHNHPFKLYEGERLDDMVESIKANGILMPIIVRELKNNYEILAGHNRTNAAKLAGLTKVPCVVKSRLTDEEAYVYVIETNLMQRSFNDLRVSEKALVLAERYDNIKSQGKRNDILREIKLLNGEKVDEKEEIVSTNNRDNIANEYGLSGASVARLLRINELIDEFKDYANDGKLPLLAGVNISYLDKDMQKEIYNVSSEYNIKISEPMSKELRELGTNNVKKIMDIMVKPKVAPNHQKVKLSSNVYNKYFKDKKADEIEKIIEDALKKYYS